MATGIFQECLSELKTFINKNPDVAITRDKVSIPAGKKDDFYKLFNETRSAFITEKCPELIKDAKPLVDSFANNLEEVSRALELEYIDIPDGLKRFTRNPADELIRILRPPLFELLKDKTDDNSFEINALRKIRQFQGDLYYQAYEDWLEISLLKLLKPKSLLKVDVPTIKGSFGHARGYVMHLDLKSVVTPQETKILSLERGFTMLSFTVPDLITYSAELGKYFSIKTEVCKANWIAVNASEKRQWIPLDGNLDIFSPGYMLIYADDDFINLALINDARKICRPDIILEFNVGNNRLSDARIKKAEMRKDFLKPKLGTLIATDMAVEELSPLKTRGDIKLLKTGSDDNRLLPIIDALKKLNSEQSKECTNI